jgi:DNA-binding CsgD family transcriptional regulator
MQEQKTGARLAFLEAAYDWNLDEDVWLTRMLETVLGLWGAPKFGFAYVYDASDTTNLRFGKPVVSGPSDFTGMLEHALLRIQKMPAEILAASYRTVTVGFGRPLGVIDEDSERVLAHYAAVDVFALNGLDASGRGAAIGLGVERASLSEYDILQYQRLNAHLASAYRLRRRLLELQQQPIDDCEAIFRPDGRLLDARGPAEAAAERNNLHLATLAMEGVRRRTSEGEPTTGWVPRIRGRWTLVDSFVSGGERYIVARENQTAPAGLDALTERERQVVASAVVGKSTKETAYELGISASTVRVLLARARSRLGVSTNEELQNLPVIRALRGLPS